MFVSTHLVPNIFGAVEHTYDTICGFSYTKAADNPSKCQVNKLVSYAIFCFLHVFVKPCEIITISARAKLANAQRSRAYTVPSNAHTGVTILTITKGCCTHNHSAKR